jgi:branched-chain amino acid transport system permease protein
MGAGSVLGGPLVLFVVHGHHWRHGLHHGQLFGAAFIVVLPIFLNQAIPVLGSLLGFEVSTAFISHAEYMVFGALIVWFLIVEPHGLARLWSLGKQKLRVWPFPH